jgi:hypothetical protein
MNDTWILDLDTKCWRRANPAIAPSPRAGHAMAYLPKSGRVAVYEGYAASSDTSYGASPATTLNPRELWLYDARADGWELASAWPTQGGHDPSPPSLGAFYGHSAGWVYDTGRRCVYVVTFRGECWAMRIDPPTLSLLEKAPEQGF